MEPAMRAEFEHWHSHEHFPERLRIPGFQRASRWREEGGDGFFVFYELESYEVLSSPAYLERLNSPTPWSTKLMPHHKNMVRAQCQVLETRGGTVARHAVTVRLSPSSDDLCNSLLQIAERLAVTAGCVGGHLVQHQAPQIAATTEQKIRGGDASADWVFIATGYDRDALWDLGDAVLKADGLAPGAVRNLYSLSHSAVRADVL